LDFRKGEKIRVKREERRENRGEREQRREMTVGEGEK
jgi:hypothetical protein